MNAGQTSTGFPTDGEKVPETGTVSVSADLCNVEPFITAGDTSLPAQHSLLPSRPRALARFQPTAQAEQTPLGSRSWSGQCGAPEEFPELEQGAARAVPRPSRGKPTVASRLYREKPSHGTGREGSQAESEPPSGFRGAGTDELKIHGRKLVLQTPEAQLSCCEYPRGPPGHTASKHKLSRVELGLWPHTHRAPLPGDKCLSHSSPREGPSRSLF